VNRLWVPIAARLICFFNASKLHGKSEISADLFWVPMHRIRRAGGLNPLRASERDANSGRVIDLP
jgi:hypothetical protein